MEDWDIKTIVVAYDGSDGSKRAAELAASLARRNSARIVVVTAFPHEPRYTEAARGVPYLGPANPELSPQVAAAMETAQAVAQECQAAGIAADAEALQGPAADAVLKVANIHDADLIVVGRHGHGAARERIIGSTVESIVREAGRPVLVAH